MKNDCGGKIKTKRHLQIVVMSLLSKVLGIREKKCQQDDAVKEVRRQEIVGMLLFFFLFSFLLRERNFCFYSLTGE